VGAAKPEGAGVGSGVTTGELSTGCGWAFFGAAKTGEANTVRNRIPKAVVFESRFIAPHNAKPVDNSRPSLETKRREMNRR
jgi:hypothetical protein